MSSTTAAPTVTVSLVTRDGIRWLPGCIESLCAQELSDLELLVTDNGSTDGTPDLLAERLAGIPRARFERLAANIGYAQAHDRAIAAASGTFVVLLNQDVELDERFLRKAVEAFERSPRVAAVQGLVQRLGPDGERLSVIDTTGLEMHRDRRVVSRDQGRELADLARPEGPVWGVDGPVPVYRRAALLDARLPRRGGGWEVLDRDFFAYKEDIDLAWRLRRLGWEAWYEPSAVAWHARGASISLGGSVRTIVAARARTPERVRLLSWRNQRLMQVKNDPIGDVLRNLPWIARREALSLGLLAVTDPRSLRVVLDLARQAPWALRKRRALGRAVRRTSRRV
jgi:GT2 family glycosyltransferase